MKLNDLVETCFNNAKAKGWHESKRSPLEFHMLMVSELAEATEEVRKQKPDVYQVQHICENSDEVIDVPPNSQSWSKNVKPEGEAIEVVDCLIRICDYAGARGWNLEYLVNMKLEYNKTRSHRHGGKAL